MAKSTAAGSPEWEKAWEEAGREAAAELSALENNTLINYEAKALQQLRTEVDNSTPIVEEPTVMESAGKVVSSMASSVCETFAEVSKASHRHEPINSSVTTPLSSVPKSKGKSTKARGKSKSKGSPFPRRRRQAASAPIAYSPLSGLDSDDTNTGHALGAREQKKGEDGGENPLYRPTTQMSQTASPSRQSQLTSARLPKVGIFSRYRTFVHNNSTVLKMLESGGQSAAYYLPSRFETGTDGEELSETCYAASQLLGLLHDSILAYPPPGSASGRARLGGDSVHQGYVAVPTEEREEEPLPVPSRNASLIAQIGGAASVLLAVISNVQVLLEMYTLRKGGAVARRRLAVRVEATKLALRLIVLAQRRSLLLFGGAFMPHLVKEARAREGGPLRSVAFPGATEGPFLSGNNASGGGGGGGGDDDDNSSSVEDGGGNSQSKNVAVPVQPMQSIEESKERSLLPSTYFGSRSGRKMKFKGTAAALNGGDVVAHSGAAEDRTDSSPMSVSSPPSMAVAATGAGREDRDMVAPAWLQGGNGDLEKNPMGYRVAVDLDDGNEDCATSRDVDLRVNKRQGRIANEADNLRSTSIITNSMSSGSENGGVIWADSPSPTTNSDEALEVERKRWIIASEALFFSRPLLQALLNQWFSGDTSFVSQIMGRAATTANQASERLRALALAVLVDLLALWCWFRAEGLRLRQRCARPLSEDEKEERRRRKMTYLFYLLRAPLWDSATRPVVDTVERGTSLLFLHPGARVS